MSFSAKKASIVLGTLASAGGLSYWLARRAPVRKAYRESIGWQSVAYARPMEPPAPTPPAAPRPTTIRSADPHPKPGFIGGVKETFYEFMNDDVMTQAAALAFYTGLAIAPLLTIVTWTARVFLPPNQKWDIAKAFSDVMGKQAYKPIEQLLGPTSQQAELGMTAAGLTSIALVAVSASGVFGQVQSALNSIWHVQAKPTNGLIGYLKKRVLSLGMLASILFLLLMSMVISTLLQGRITVAGDTWGNLLAVIGNNVMSVAIFTVVFAGMFKFVPDAKIGWREVWVGGFIGALLFSIGKFGLSFYLGRGSYETAYTAAIGSFVALLVWVYYSAVILLVGAEATEVYARRRGQPLRPDDHAVRVITLTDPPT
ncbi:MAG: YihY/virulence factor BrkB family protein [Tepidisphaeraceae bacterium]